MLKNNNPGIISDIEGLYNVLMKIEKRNGGKRRLASCNGKMNWPRRGVYFFFEAGEDRNSGAGLRIVRVGTHAVSAGSGTTLWNRLRTHRGVRGGGGNHRGSIFRLHVGTALLARGDYPDEVKRSWGRGSSAPKEVRRAEHELECAVSEYIGKMPFLWLKVDDEPGPVSMRKYIERNAVALLSAASRLGIDPPSEGWLGHGCRHEVVRSSGLWNVNHVFEDYDPDIFQEKTTAKLPQAPVCDKHRGWVQSQTFGGKAKRFCWKIDDGCNIHIMRTFSGANGSVIPKIISPADIERLNDFMAASDWVPLANNVEKLRNREEKRGVGWFLYEHLGWSIMDSQLASHLGVILTLSGVWAYNGKKINIEFRLLDKDWQSCVRDYYNQALSK